MRTSTSRRQRKVLAAAVGVALAGSGLFMTSRALGASDTWGGSLGTVWSDGANWSTNSSAPGAGEMAVFCLSASVVNNNTTIDLGAGATAGYIMFESADAAAYTIGAGGAGAQTLTLDSVGNAIILNSEVTNNQTFHANLALSNTNEPATYTFANNSTSAVLNFGGGISASSAGIKVLQIDGVGETNISGAITAGAGSMNLFKTGAGTLVLFGGGAFAGDGAPGNVPTDGLFPVVLREGLTKVTGGTYAVTGEMVIGGVFEDGGNGFDSTLQMDGGTINVAGWFSVGRGNGIGGVSTNVVLNNDSVLSANDFSAGYNGGNIMNAPRGSITLNGASRISSAGQFFLAESPGSDFSLTLNGSSVLSVGNQFRVAGTSGLGTFTMNDNASATVGYFAVGRGDNNTHTATGTAYLNGGTFTSTGDVVLGYAGVGNLGRLEINGATMNVATTVERWMIIDQWDTSQGQLDMNSGTLNLNSNTDMRFLTGNSGTSGVGTVNQNGGAITFYSDNATTISGTAGVIDLAQSGSATAMSTYNLNGGTLTVGRVISNSNTPTRTFNFNGGVIKPTGSHASWINIGTGSASLNVLSGGAKIDTNGFDVTIAQPLLGSGGDGGLTKDGAGALTLTGDNTYTGPTNINAGRLVLNGNLAATSGVNVGSGAILDLTNNAAGTLTTNALSLNNSVLNIEFVNGVNDRIDVLGTVNTTGTSTLNLNVTAGALTPGAYTLISGTSGLGSGFALGTVPVGFYTYDLAASTATAEVLTVTGINPTPTIAYWTGVASTAGADATNKWTAGSATTMSNWSTTPDGLSDPLQVPGLTTDVIFSAANSTGASGALNTTLDGSYSIKSLTIDVPLSTGITSIGIDTDGRTLSVDNGGIVLAATSNAGATISGTGSVKLLGSQTWANESNTGALTVNVPISPQSGAATLTVGGSGSADVSLEGGISGNASVVVNKPAGATNLSGVSSFSGSANIMAGTVNVAGSLTSSGVLHVGGEGGTGVMNIGDGASVTVNNTMNVGYRTGDGTLNITGGNLTTTSDFRVGGSNINGPQYDATGTVNISGGTVNLSSLTVARGNFNDNSAAGTVNLSGGLLNSVNDVILGYAGSGLANMTISGGTFNVGTTATKWMMLGFWDSTKGQLNMSDGAMNLNFGSSLIFGRETNQTGAATINQSGGSITAYSDFATTVGGGGVLDMQYRGTGTFSSEYNLDGGTLAINRILSSRTSGTRVFNFNGGTLKAVANQSDFMNLGAGTATVNVRDGGAKIDTNGYNVRIASPLAHSNIAGDAAIDGGLTKSGAGELVLSSPATYTGPTSVLAGSLVMRNSKSQGGAIVVGDGANLTLINEGLISSFAGTSMTLGGATGSSLGFNLGVAGNPTAPQINLSGGLTRDGANVVNILGGNINSGTVTLVQYAGGETGSGNFTLGTLPNRVTATIHDLGSGKVDVNFVADTPKWTGLGDGSWTTELQSPQNWVTRATATPTDYVEGDLVRFDDSASNTFVNLATNVNPAVVVFDHSASDYTLTGTGNILGTTGLLKSGSRTLNFSLPNGNTFSGGVVISAGTLDVLGTSTNTAAVLGTGPISNNGTLVFSRAVGAAGQESRITNDISGSGRIIVRDGTVFSGNNTFTGQVNVEGGRLFLDSGSALGTSAGGVTVNDGGSLGIFQGDFNFGDSLTISGSGGGSYVGAIQVGNANRNVTWSGPITMAGSTTVNVDVGSARLNITGGLSGAGQELSKIGPGRLVLASDASYAGSSINAGTLQIGNGGTLGNVGDGFISLTGALEVNRSDTYAIPNNISGTGTVLNSGTGTAILTDMGSTIGTAAASNGTLILQGAGFINTFAVNANGVVRVANDNYNMAVSTVTINSNNAQTGALELSNGVNNPFNGMPVYFAGRNNATTGLRSTNGENTLNGSIVLNGGGSDYRIEATPGGTFNITAGISGNGTIASGTRSVTFAGDGVGTMSGSITNGGASAVAVAKAGEGTWTLTSANDYTGPTTVNGGRLVLQPAAHAPVLTGAGGAVVNGGRLVLDYTGGASPASEVLTALKASAATDFVTGQIRTTNARVPEAGPLLRGIGWIDDTVNQQVRVAYTYLGDSQLDGDVDLDDVGPWSTNFTGELGGIGATKVWAEGDWDYDGDVDLDDVGPWSVNFTGELGGTGLSLDLGSAISDVHPTAMAALQGMGITVVPEPSMLGAVGLGLAAAALRRRIRKIR